MLAEWQIEKHTTDGNFEAFLNAKKEANELDEVTSNADGTFDVEKDGYILTIKDDGSILDASKTGPKPQISNIKVVANSDGTGDNLPAKGRDEGIKLYITFDHSIESGTTTVTPTLPFEVTKNGTYTFTVTGTVNGETSTKPVNVTVNQYSSAYKIGDYVNYTYDRTDKEGNALTYSLPSTKSGYSDRTIAQSSTTLQWRILNIDETTGTIDLVSAPTSNSVYFEGALGYNNGVYLLNDICAKLYSNSSKGITARSINLEDTEKHLTTAGLNARNSYNNGTATYGSTKTYTSYYWYPNLYEYEIGSGVKVTEENASSITQPDKTIANLDPYKESKASPSTSFTVPTTATTETNSRTQASNSVLTVTQTYYGGSNISFNTTNYGEAGDVLKADNYYWVASRSAYCDSSLAYFGLRYVGTGMSFYGLFDSNSYALTGHYRLRPVVSLSSSILSDTKDADGHWNLK